MAQFATNQFRKGLKIEFEGSPYEIIDFQHISPGKGRAFTRTKLRNLLNGSQLERTITSGDKFDQANTENREMQFLYKDNDGFHFMNQANFEQIQLNENEVGPAKDFLQENGAVDILFYNDRAIAVEVPPHVILKIIETDPAFKGDTVTGGTKPAKLETGAMVQVPFHLKEGDLIKVDTRDYSYVEKANK